MLGMNLFKGRSIVEKPANARPGGVSVNIPIKNLGNQLEKDLLELVERDEGYYESYGEEIGKSLRDSKFNKNKPEAREFAKKADHILNTWNELIDRWDRKHEKTEELLSEFEELKKNADKLLEEISEWKEPGGATTDEFLKKN